MKARDIIGLIIALVLALGIAFLTRKFLAADAPPPPKTQTVVKKENTDEILIAAKSLAVGTRVGSGDMRWQPWPQSASNSNYLTHAKANLKDLEGSVVRSSLAQGEPVTLEDILKPGDRSNLAAVIEEGKRAISIDVNAATSGSGLIQPGDHVDVIVAKTEGNETGKTSTVSEMVVSNVKVVAVDNRLGATQSENVKAKVSGEAPVPKTATLEVSTAQAEALVKATKSGELFLSLHSFSTLGKEDTCKDGVCNEDENTYTIKVMRAEKQEDVQVKSEKK